MITTKQQAIDLGRQLARDRLASAMNSMRFAFVDAIDRCAANDRAAQRDLALLACRTAEEHLLELLKEGKR